jgi:hypothetical protein
MSIASADRCAIGVGVVSLIPTFGACAKVCEQGWTDTNLKTILVSDVAGAAQAELLACPGPTPMTVFLQTQRGNCVATVLDDRTLLTAAHCFAGDDEEAKAYVPQIKKNVRVRAHCTHPLYEDDCTGAYDLAVARLDVPEDLSLGATRPIWGTVSQAAREQGAEPDGVERGTSYAFESGVAWVSLYRDAPFRVFLAASDSGTPDCFGTRASASEWKGDLVESGRSLVRLAVIAPSSKTDANLTWSGSPAFVSSPGDGEGGGSPRIIGVVSYRRDQGDVPVISVHEVDAAFVDGATEALAKLGDHGASAGDVECPRAPGSAADSQAAAEEKKTALGFDRLRLGFAQVSDQPTGVSGAGASLGSDRLYPFWGPAPSPCCSIAFSPDAEFVFASADVEDRRSFVFLADMLLGFRLRFGESTALVLGAYGAPTFAYYGGEDKVAFIAGVAGSMGLMFNPRWGIRLGYTYGAWASEPSLIGLQTSQLSLVVPLWKSK